ncbi:4-hydroxy-tetrahydrodipicolinate synthase [Terribacillus saccharophilus]|uniref:4-hydroxy-tetrahydrodipicolinate synthase n=1 Tax=Terribacillus saccharophilus TaxID=361277 RepID=A0ABX4H363_9BACI|nr:4-hydroxy-tetrahydrodipicolinate synthase [Terribacillus saccharophilus]PAD37056.1 4-hydroxy-tetrahydrodipicolinate synthase [Terribacillus saccharophilus]PAD97532.1 4-hydroxy-tetrahydrodipicolinate synthase [Terribacillus saccharophilus]PAE01581.1 4-hydroxy-tetrahydrodipicolinate synthase [Terribacillus saccharophilus]
MKFGKVITAMVTPFDNQGQIDFDATTRLLDYLIENGTNAVVVAGTTGESPTLSHEEKLSLFRHVVKTVDGRIPIIAGTGSNNTQASIELTKEAEEIGVDAALIVAPYYNKPNQRGLYAHFEAVANSTKLPIMLYNIPGRSVVKIEPETVMELSKISNIVSVKDSTGDLSSMTKVIAGTPDDFSLYSGDDDLTLPVAAIGGNGIVSVSSHVVGNEIQAMLQAYEAGNIGEASRIHQQILPIMQGLFQAPNPTPVKEALNQKGIAVGGVRLPLVELTDEEKENVSKLLK